MIFEDLLIQADLGVDDGHAHHRSPVARAATTRASSPEDVRSVLADEVERVLTPVANPLAASTAHQPHVILVVGVNGTGKTTTIGKLAQQFARERQEGHAGRRRHVPRRRHRSAQDLG